MFLVFIPIKDLKKKVGSLLIDSSPNSIGRSGGRPAKSSFPKASFISLKSVRTRIRLLPRGKLKKKTISKMEYLVGRRCLHKIRRIYVPCFSEMWHFRLELCTFCLCRSIFYFSISRIYRAQRGRPGLFKVLIATKFLSNFIRQLTIFFIDGKKKICFLI